jgi:4,5-DOPA dioxygenase extradiol
MNIVRKKTMSSVMFIGHGSPLNAIEKNEYSRVWKEISDSIPKPDAILCISAHWVTNKTKVLTAENPKTIHDFYGFPIELHNIEYKAPGSLKYANKTLNLLGDIAEADNKWGFDHGSWSVLHLMYPEADIPTYQLSIDMNLSSIEQFEIGKKLKELRNDNVLIIGSGNVVHNLGMLEYNFDGGFDWAVEFDDYIKQNVENRNFESVINYQSQGKKAKYSVPTNEHFVPLIYILGAVNENDNLKVYNNSCMAGSLSMTSFVFTE